MLIGLLFCPLKKIPVILPPKVLILDNELISFCEIKNPLKRFEVSIRIPVMEARGPASVLTAAETKLETLFFVIKGVPNSE